MPIVDGERIYTELLRYLDNTTMRRAAAEALGRLGAVAVTPEELARLVALTTAPDSSGRLVAAEALGQLGAGAATPEVLRRLVDLTTAPDSGVRQAAARALGQLGAGATTPEVLERLAQFWQGQLAHSERQYIDYQRGQDRDIAYRQLQQIAARPGTRIEEHHLPSS